MAHWHWLHAICYSVVLLKIIGLCSGLILPTTNTATRESGKLSSSSSAASLNTPLIVNGNNNKNNNNNSNNSNEEDMKMVETIKSNTKTNIAASKTHISEPNFFQKFQRRFSVYLLATRIFLSYKLTQRREIKLKRSLGSTKSDDLDDHPAVTQLWSNTHGRNASLLLTQIRRLEGFWIKVGQYLSSRADIMPPEYLTALAVLQDRMPPKDFEGEIMPTLREELGGDARGSEGTLLDRFDWIDPVPLSTASLAQVHRATLKPTTTLPLPPGDEHTGHQQQHRNRHEKRQQRHVVIKVQHRGVSSLLLQDMANLKSILSTLARFEGPEADYTPIFTEYSTEVRSELDFRLEASNMSTVRRLLAANGVTAIVPRAVDGLVTQRVLTMDYCPGFVIRDVERLDDYGVDRDLLLGRVVRAWAVQMHVGGVFNADPHPGNILVSTARGGDASVPVLLDFGLTKRLSPPIKVAFARLMHASNENDLDGLLTSFDEMGLKMNRDDPFEDMASMRRSFGSTVPQSQAREESKARSDGYKRRVEAMKEDQGIDTKDKKQKLRNPVDAWPAELIFFGRVTNMLRGLCSRLEVRYPYLETMAVAAGQTLKELVPVEERADQLIYSPPLMTTTSGTSAETKTTAATTTTTTATATLQQRLIGAIHQLEKDDDMVGLQITVISNSKTLVNLAAGTLGTANPRPITPSTLFCVFSVSKAILTIGVLRLLQDGHIDSLDDPVANYWPAFGANGKERITIRHVLGHRAGLANVMPDYATVDVLSDFEFMVEFMEGAKAEHEAGERTKYHYFTYAWICGGLIEKVTGRRYEDYLNGILTGTPMTATAMAPVQPSPVEALDIYIGGVPEDLDENRLAVVSLDKKPIITVPANGGTKEAMASKKANTEERSSEGDNPKDRRKALAKYQGQEQMLNASVFNMRKLRAARIPSVNGHASALALATLFDSLVSPTTTAYTVPLESHIVDLARGVQQPPPPLPSDATTVPASSSTNEQKRQGDSKQAMLSDGASFGLGFQSHSIGLVDGRIVRSIGHSGYGGSIVIAIPEANLSVAVVMNKLSAKSKARVALLKIVFDEFGLSYPSSLEM